MYWWNKILTMSLWLTMTIGAIFTIPTSFYGRKRSIKIRKNLTCKVSKTPLPRGPIYTAHVRINVYKACDEYIMERFVLDL